MNRFSLMGCCATLFVAYILFATIRFTSKPIAYDARWDERWVCDSCGAITDSYRTEKSPCPECGNKPKHKVLCRRTFGAVFQNPFNPAWEVRVAEIP